MIDIVDALLNVAEDYEKKYYFPCNLNRTAAAEIARLRAEVVRYRTALEIIASAHSTATFAIERARQALKEVSE